MTPLFPSQPVASIYFFTMQLGSYPLYIMGKNDKIIHLTFNRQHHEQLCSRYPHSPTPATTQVDSLAQIVQHAINAETNTTFPADSPFIAAGSKFQQQVWQQISLIPRRLTLTYGQLANRIGNPKAYRAVGQACNRNPLGILIPCHRVVAKNGLGGFAGGGEVKRWLLTGENKNKKFILRTLE